MSVVIIGNGDGVRNAVTALETASITMTEKQRSIAEDALLNFAAQIGAIKSLCEAES